MTLNVLTLNQSNFTQRILDRFGFKDCNSLSTPTNTSIKLSGDMAPTTPDDVAAMVNVPYREAVGSLMYLMIGSRPDIAYAVSLISRYMEHQ